jgi:hypothetical protein
MEDQQREQSRKQSSGKLVASQRQAPKEADREHTKPLDDFRMQMMRDIMSYQVASAANITNKLRPNRGPEACRNLRYRLAYVSVVNSIILVPIVIVITLVIATSIFNHERYIQDYPGCDIELEQLHREHGLATWRWWHRLTSHESIAIAFDILENYVLWAETGLAYFSILPYASIINYDLKLYWAGLHRKIERLMRLASGQNGIGVKHQSSQTYSSPGITNYQYKWDSAIFELQMEFVDFMAELRRHNSFMTDLISAALSIWFVFFAFITHNTIGASVPIEFILLLSLVFIVLTGVWYTLLTLHRHCLRTYPLLCSLMALDQSRYKKQFVEILDYYGKQQTCYTIYRTYPMTTTTYLTIVGYSFSCFFLLCSERLRH